MLNTSRNASRIPSKIKEKNQDEDLEVDSIIEKTKKFINLRSDDTPTLDIHLMIVLDESNLIIDEPPLTPQDFVSSITKLGESNLKVKSIIDITQYFENNKISIDTLEEKRRSKEHSIKDFVICDINKKTEYLLKMITKIDQKDERIREVLKNRYNYIVMFN